MTEPAADPKCPKCGALMRIVQRAPHTTRPPFERQTVACSRCEYSTFRTVDAAGRLVR